MTAFTADLSRTEVMPFLRSPLWEERPEMPLTVLSALARLDVDPWEEAALLARLSPDEATRSLRAALTRLPGSATCLEIDAICRGAVHLLPRAPDRPPSAAARRNGTAHHPSTQTAGIGFLPLLLWMVLLSLVVSHNKPSAASAVQAGSKPAQRVTIPATSKPLP